MRGMKKVAIIRRPGAASVIRQIRILEPAILSIDQRIKIEAFSEYSVVVWLPFERFEAYRKKKQIPTHFVDAAQTDYRAGWSAALEFLFRELVEEDGNDQA